MSMPQSWVWCVLAIVFGFVLAVAWIAQRLLDEVVHTIEGMGPN